MENPMSDEQIKGLEARIHRLERIVGRVYALEGPSSWSFGSAADISASKKDAVSEGRTGHVLDQLSQVAVDGSVNGAVVLWDAEVRELFNEISRRAEQVRRERDQARESQRTAVQLKLKAQGELDAANQHVKILQDSLADLSASKRDAVSEGRTIDPFFVPGAARKPSDIARRCFNLINRLTAELEEANLHVKSMPFSELKEYVSGVVKQLEEWEHRNRG